MVCVCVYICVCVCVCTCLCVSAEPEYLNIQIFVRITFFNFNFSCVCTRVCLHALHAYLQDHHACLVDQRDALEDLHGDLLRPLHLLHVSW